MIEERDLDAPWEPRTFKVGDRVRVRLSGECRMTYTLFDDNSPERVQNSDGHYQEEDGAIGTVREWDELYGCEQSKMGHTVAVWFDYPCPFVRVTGIDQNVWLTSRSYAAIELEPLEASCPCRKRCPTPNGAAA